MSLPENPVRLVKRPRYNNERTRRLLPGEEERVLQAVAACDRNDDGTWAKGVHTPWLKPIVIFAVETAMRQSEITGLLWQNINLASGVAFLPNTKNGTPRAVPLSEKAREILRSLPRSLDGRVFPMTSNAVKLSWQRAMRRAGIDDLHFHDLRHEATSRLAKRVPNIVELAAITGHRDVNMLRRYYHVSAEELAQKIS